MDQMLKSSIGGISLNDSMEKNVNLIQQDREISKDLLNEMKVLKKYESEILKALKDEKMAKIYFLDPKKALEKMGIEISPKLEKMLEKVRLPEESLNIKTFILPNGQVVTPRFTVRFTSQGDKR
ncbi:MAG: hypothetical protein ABFC91_00605 [Methanobacteriaceae archaeon]